VDRGCLYDFCATRAGLDRKLREATFCDDCRKALERAGLCRKPADTIARVIARSPPAPSPPVN